MYSSLEEIEGKDLFLFLGKLQRATTDQRRLKHAIAFAESTMIGLAASLPAGTARGESMDIRDSTRNPHIAKAGNAYLARPNSGTLAALLLAMRQTPGVHVARADLFNRAVGVLKKHSVAPQLTLAEAAESTRHSLGIGADPLVAGA